MKKIGTTSTGNIIVEMTSEEFDSLELTISPKKKDEKIAPAPATKPMTIRQYAEYAAPRLIKLQAKKKDGVLSSIKAMFQFSGGIEDGKIDQVFSELLRMRILQENGGKITYN